MRGDDFDPFQTIASAGDLRKFLAKLIVNIGRPDIEEMDIEIMKAQVAAAAQINESYYVELKKAALELLSFRLGEKTGQTPPMLAIGQLRMNGHAGESEPPPAKDKAPKKPRAKAKR